MNIDLFAVAIEINNIDKEMEEGDEGEVASAGVSDQEESLDEEIAREVGEGGVWIQC